MLWELYVERTNLVQDANSNKNNNTLSNGEKLAKRNWKT